MKIIRNIDKEFVKYIFVLYVLQAFLKNQVQFIIFVKLYS